MLKTPTKPIKRGIVTDREWKRDLAAKLRRLADDLEKPETEPLSITFERTPLSRHLNEWRLTVIEEANAQTTQTD